jgi:hypothetical protein
MSINTLSLLALAAAPEDGRGHYIGDDQQLCRPGVTTSFSPDN